MICRKGLALPRMHSIAPWPLAGFLTLSGDVLNCPDFQSREQRRMQLCLGSTGEMSGRCHKLSLQPLHLTLMTFEAQSPRFLYIQNRRRKGGGGGGGGLPPSW